MEKMNIKIIINKKGKLITLYLTIQSYLPKEERKNAWKNKNTQRNNNKMSILGRDVWEKISWKNILKKILHPNPVYQIVKKYPVQIQPKYSRIQKKNYFF